MCGAFPPLERALKFSIITVVYNNASTIRCAGESVLEQDYDDLEYIIIDGDSTDGTVEVVKLLVDSYKDRLVTFVSEKDNGIYDAMNKGIKFAKGQIIGILNSDDYYASTTVISDIASQFVTTNADSIFADLLITRRENQERISRYYDAGNFSPDKFAYGWMPPHPTFFVKRDCYEKYGLYKTDYRIAADYELLVRFMFKHRISYSYMPKVIVKMRSGGLSTKSPRSNWIINREIVRACRENGVETNILKVLSKYPAKLFQLVRRPK
jgi:glycosyltransferase involved in cell wall biosynthesis